MVIKEYCCADVLSFIYFIALRDASSKVEIFVSRRDEVTGEWR
jgi:hypothetical protein